MSSTIRSKRPDSAWSSPLGAVGARRSAGGPRPAGPWRRTRRCAPRPRRSGCGPSGRPRRSGRRSARQGDHERGRRGARRRRARRRRRGRRRWRARSRARGRSPRRPARTRLRPKRSKICSRSSAGHAGAGVAHPEPHRRAVVAGRAERDASPGSVCLTALSASWSSAWVSRCSSSAARAAGGAVELPVAVAQRRAPWRARDWVSSARSTSARVEEVGPVGSWPAGSGRRPAATSGRSRRAAAPGSRRPRRGRSASSSSRWPRRTVSGVLSSWPASSRNCRCADERRLEPVEHAVEGAGQRGDVVVAALRDAAREVGLGDLVGRSRAGCAAAPAAGRTGRRRAR